MNYAIAAEDWDEIAEESRIPHLQRHGVPVTDEGVYLPNYHCLEMKTVEGKSTWIHHWN